MKGRFLDIGKAFDVERDDTPIRREVLGIVVVIDPASLFGCGDENALGWSAEARKPMYL